MPGRKLLIYLKLMRMAIWIKNLANIILISKQYKIILCE